jgi:hypothetical protein
MLMIILFKVTNSNPVNDDNKVKGKVIKGDRGRLHCHVACIELNVILHRLYFY